MKKDPRALSVLIVEDNPGDQILIEDYLGEYFTACTLHQAYTFKEAIEVFKQRTEPIDIILLDLTLPDTSGEELIKGMLAHSGQVPIIVLTGFTDIEFSIKSLSLGISDYLLKDELSATTIYKSVLYNIERARHIRTIQESEKRYSDLFHFSPQPMWVYDLDSLAFLNVNKAAVQHYGYSEEEFMQMTIRELRPAEDLPLLYQSIEEQKVSKEKAFKGVFRHFKKDGTSITVEVRANMIHFNGKISNLVLINDITESLRYIDTIERQNQSLREIAWMQSHLVRAPLARIMGLIALIEDPELEMETKSEFLQYVIESATELDSIIKDMVKRTEHVKFETDTKTEVPPSILAKLKG
ncbi:PAS domain S-box protein [Cytophagales bacterium LB-30]|uniref:histidine kinase n=1 Tax=Shiella aurantiaca TaxID=3058365 RepID=A0ABT8F680_9BACT|nr:PAS domain S-box protein [Shiella aurantiaca]MDN4165960.1 PAS domain S-box protein [Shiella aurantiaca]